MDEPAKFRNRDIIFCISCFPIFLMLELTNDPDVLIPILAIFFVGWALFFKNGLALRQLFKVQAEQSRNLGDIRRKMGLLHLTEFFLASPFLIIVIIVQRRDFIFSLTHT